MDDPDDRFDVLDPDLSQHTDSFRKIASFVGERDGRLRELHAEMSQLRRQKMSTDSECSRRDEELRTLHMLCAEQEKTIASLYPCKDKYTALMEENKNLTEENMIFKQKIQAVENKKENEKHKLILKFNVDLEKCRKKYEQEVQELKSTLEINQATTDVQSNKIQQEFSVLNAVQQEKLQQALETEKNLKQQISIMKGNISTNMTVYQKKVYELEQTVRKLEQEKAGNFKSPRLLNVPRNKVLNDNQKLNKIGKPIKICKNDYIQSNVTAEKKNRFKQLNISFTEDFEESTKLNITDAVQDSAAIDKMITDFVSSTCDDVKPSSTVNECEDQIPNAGKTLEFPIAKRRKLYVPNTFDHMDYQ